MIKSDLAIQSSAPTHHSLFRGLRTCEIALREGVMKLLVDGNVAMWAQRAF